MKTLLLGSFLAIAASTYVYPVRVQILDGHHDSIGRGSGHGNVYDLNLGMQGFDYVFAGCVPFQASVGAERYQARWRSPQRLVMVTTPIGSDRSRECTLRVTRRDFVYTLSPDGKLGTQPFGGRHAN